MNVCGNCADMFGTEKKKGAIGMWKAVCEICGKPSVCAESCYDFGISDEQVKVIKAFCADMRKESTERGWMML